MLLEFPVAGDQELYRAVCAAPCITNDSPLPSSAAAKPTNIMESLTSRLDALRPKIEELMRIGGTPGLSLGVMHQGTQVYFASYGYRDVEQRLPPNEETILPVCSLTKAVTSAALGILVDENKAGWDTLVKDALPSLDIKDETL
ncbi:beta-lactamase/transpeptidase-like protein [Chaetomium sp. MPI-SDFR-AT-0129]|nr:beta-lactamase/transpeptidase-like protein [Chaetomium sp. MPI-SDFR-AT-0129]